MMTPRIDFYNASPCAIKAMTAMEKAVGKMFIEPRLLHLIKLRASQINGCSFCVDKHSADAREAGESERRLYALAAWRETPFFSDRERAVLAWTESVTRLSETHAPDEDYSALAAYFSEKEMMDITLAICTINSWNRLAVGFRLMPEP